jgi:hypothetical protein
MGLTRLGCWTVALGAALLAGCGEDDDDPAGGSGGGSSGGSGAAGGAQVGGSSGTGATAAAGSTGTAGTGASSGAGGSGQTGGSSGSGGGSGLPPARGASSFGVTSDGCAVGPGDPIPIPWDPSEITTSTVLGTMVPDGTANAQISCTVRANGETFEISASLQHGSRSFTVSAILAPDADGYSGQATVSQDDDSTGPLQSAADGCTVTVLPTQQVAPARVWGSFACPAVSDPGGSSGECSAEGSFALENCES